MPRTSRLCAVRSLNWSHETLFSMVQQAIDAVKEEGQYQAIKYLFEMIGLYPAAAEDESQAHDSLAQTLLEHLGLTEVTEQEPTAKKVTAGIP